MAADSSASLWAGDVLERGRINRDRDDEVTSESLLDPPDISLFILMANKNVW